MNILIINHYAGNPKLGMEFRPYYLAKEWVNLGHKVFIIGASNSHLRNSQPGVVKELSKDEFEGITYYWIKTPSYSGNIKRILNILIFVLKLIYFRKKISKLFSPNLVIASSTYPLDIYPSFMIAKISKAKLCFEVHDLWPLSPMIIGGYSKYHPYIMLLQMAENFAYKKSNVVVSLLGNAKKHMVNHGLEPSKFIHIPNGYDKIELESIQEEVPFEHFAIINELKNNGKFLVGYTGGHAPSNAMHVLINAAQLLINNSDIYFILVGNGSSKVDLQKQAKSLNNVIFLPPIPKRTIPKLLAKLDVLYIGGVKTELHKHGISPNKLIDYMLAAKPIILSADVENEIVEKCNCGITIPAEDHLQVSNAILIIYNMLDNDRVSMGERGKNFIFNNYDYKNLASLFINKIENEL
ncbi:MAG: glycosyltransferase family 4 protein [Bacteroidales bacterium]|nr:glycosyltransferase family 4 protein [Bacteroidales bacterium]